MKKFIVLFIAAMALAITQCKPEVPETPLSPTGEPELVKSTVAKIHGYRTTFIQMRNTNTSTVNLCFNVEYLREGRVICKNHDYYAFYKNYLGPGESWMFYDYYAPLDYDEIKIVNLEYAKTNDAVKMTLVKEEKNIGNLVLGFVTDSEITFQAQVQVAFYWNDHLVDFVEKIFLPEDDLEAAYEVYESYDRYEIFTSAL